MALEPPLVEESHGVALSPREANAVAGSAGEVQAERGALHQTLEDEEGADDEDELSEVRHGGDLATSKLKLCTIWSVSKGVTYVAFIRGKTKFEVCLSVERWTRSYCSRS